ncbi:GNAT family N-acetyltransferase [Melittangium boletus]|uniref:GNAT family N-acetyltransferase n=1 Tax=Melittangium boletus TaxID=83453 RepID=UPI003DA266A4
MRDIQLGECSPQAAREFVSARGLWACEWPQAERFLWCHESGVPRAVLGLGPVLALRYDSATSAEALLSLVRALEPDWRELRCAGDEPPRFLEHGSPPSASFSRVHRLTASRLAPAARVLEATVSRRARREDLPRLLELNLSAAVERLGAEATRLPAAAFQADVLASIERGEEHVMEHAGRLVFIATALEAAPDLGLVENVFTDPAARGQGLGAWGLHRLCETLLQRWPRLLVEVEDENSRAARLYQHLGFTHTETLWCVHRPPEASGDTGV